MKNRDILDSIGRIDASLIEEADRMPVRKRHTWLKPLVLVASLCVVVGAVTAVALSMRDKDDLPPITVGGETTTDEGVGNVQIPNPFIPCATLQAAADIAGFSLDAPDAYGAYDHTVIQAIEGEMIEVIYEDASETEGLRIRKGVGTDPISGDDNRYDSEETQTIAGISVSVRKNGDLIFVAEWTDGGYAHSITSEDGLTADELETLVSQVH